ncbi:MAG: response regulator [Spirochaetaceae bacterium]|nr:MAG: response regulator [Spirochaetaceae bacterium]
MGTGKMRKTVLLVDDDTDFVEMHRKLLAEHGYKVLSAFNGRDCLELVHGEKPDLIVLDMMMESEVVGFHLSRELRNCEHTKAIPLVMITSVNEKIPFRVEPDNTWLPVDALIEKPVDPLLFLDVVDKILRE